MAPVSRPLFELVSEVRGTGAIAVAVATRDRPSALDRCLGSLLGGTVLPGQITVVDQGRDGGSRKIVRARERGDVVMTYVPQAPRGLSASRNAALEHTPAPVIAFTDDDCVVDRRWLERLCAAFAGMDPPAAVTGRVLALGPPTPGTHAVSLRTGTERVEYRGRTVPWRVGTGANIAISREWAKRIGGFDERLGAGSPGRAAEDADILYRLLVAGAHVRYEPGAIVYHERLSNERRLATRAAYGHGIGAVCGLHLRRGDLFALPMMGSWTRTVARQLWRATAARDRSGLVQGWLSVRGTAAGLAYGLRAASVDLSRAPADRPGHSASEVTFR